jgi:1,4-dihydroxy-2-naphthoyl-CoA hydrolase
MDDSVRELIMKPSGLNQVLGIELRELTPERVVATMPVTPRLHQPLGYLHGGASLVLAETVASVGAFLHCPPGKIAFGQEINANHLRPVRDGVLTAIGTPLHAGRSSHVWEIKIYDEAERLICVSRCTVAIVTAERKGGAEA